MRQIKNVKKHIQKTLEFGHFSEISCFMFVLYAREGIEVEYCHNIEICRKQELFNSIDNPEQNAWSTVKINQNLTTPE